VSEPGKEVLFMVDGCIDAYADDVFACGARGIITEPHTDFKTIARKHKDLNGVKGSIMLLNGYTAKTVLRVGRKVRIPKGTWSILVDKSLFKLYLLYEGAPFKTYTIAIGKDDKTPTANFTVGVRNPKPKWYPPSDFHRRGPIPYGDPENPLGEYWIGLEHNFHQGFGIHGTNEPETLGQKASNGCIRMDNREILEIAAVSFKGMQVAFVD
jgi:lipoprotein-anchoring transpeptidase ErfK/SrfK